MSVDNFKITKKVPFSHIMINQQFRLGVKIKLYILDTAHGRNRDNTKAGIGYNQLDSFSHIFMIGWQRLNMGHLPHFTASY